MVAQELTVERYAGVTDEQRVLLLRGPLTVETTPQFERAVRNENAETIILDLSDVPYIDSVGLGSLVAAYVSHQKTGRCLVLTGVTPRVLKGFADHESAQLFHDFSHHLGSSGSTGQHGDSVIQVQRLEVRLQIVPLVVWPVLNPAKNKTDGNVLTTLWIDFALKIEPPLKT
ncbi:MAG: STAS domain-containing protein [Terriglobales bacterium]